MCADLVLRKRAAMHVGEVGLFLDTEVFAAEFGHIKMNSDVEVKATQPRSLRQLRFAWALARKVADSGALGEVDHTDAMDWLKMKCRHVRYVTNVHRNGTETIVVPKSIRFAAMDQTAFQRLMNRMIYVVVSEVLPDVPEGVLRAEIEAMAGVTAPEPEQKPAPKRRRTPALPAPISVIPPVDEAGPADVAPPSPPPRASAPEPAPPTSPAAGDQAAPVAVARPDPTNVQTWKDYCKAWLDEVHANTEMSDVDVLAKWNGEQKLRNRCGVVAEDRQGHFAYMTAIVEEKRERQAKRVGK